MNPSIAAEEIARSPSRLARWRSIRERSLRLFAADGFADVSIDDIAREADLSRRTFFNYFPTKASVLFDPDPQESIHLAEFLAATAPDADLWTGLCAGLNRYLRSEEEVVAARGRILRVEPSLATLHMVANATFERSLTAWLEDRGLDLWRSEIMAAVALAVVRESFRRWDPRDGYAVFMTEVASGWALAGAGFLDVERHAAPVMLGDPGAEPR